MPQNEDEQQTSMLAPAERLAPSALRPEFLKALARAGVKVEDVKIVDVPEYTAVTLEDICTIPSSRKGCEGESPLMVVRALTLFPEATDFKGYTGYFRVECVTEDGEFVAWTHYMFANDTGERSPLYEWVEPQTPPFLVKVANMSTRRGFNVYRPIPQAAMPATERRGDAQ